MRNTINYQISFKQADQLDDMIKQFGYTKTIATIQNSELFDRDENERAALCDYINNHKMIRYRHA